MRFGRIHGQRRSLTWSHDSRTSWLNTNSASARYRGANSQTSGSGRPHRAGFGWKGPLARVLASTAAQRPCWADFALYGLVKSVDKTRLQLLGCSQPSAVYKSPESRPNRTMPPAPSSPRPIRRLIGYARVSTEDQATDAQVDELRAAGCGIVHEEHGSGASRARPVVAKLMREIGGGDVLVVVRLDRLARSVSHLLQVIETLEERGAHFRSLRDPIDTSTPQGMFSLQVLGAVAQLERALIAERTKAGMKAAKARGKLPGNPGLRERRPEAIRAVAAARGRVYLGDLIASAPTWLPTVQRMRPQHSWDDVVRVLNHRGQRWTIEKLRRAAHRLVRERMAEPHLIERSPRRPPEDRLMTLVAGIAIADPDRSLREIAAQLEQMRERTPRGARQWAASSVKALLDQARRLGLVVPDPAPGS
jgi:DNA invertase Pin-like site-specific DNA recombinase